MSISYWHERRIEENTLDNPQFQYRIDQSRIIHSTAFRRLQGKTQVIGINQHDFFRTRLTHSLEVAQIGKRLTQRAHWLFSQKNRWPGTRFSSELLPTADLIETACLSHDLGHPAFGHNGEKILNYFMHPLGGFEGNGQSLRVLARLGEYSNGFGYNLTRRSLLSIIKYPVLHSECKKSYPSQRNDESIPRNIKQWTPPKCLHDDEHDILNWILEPFIDSDKEKFTSLAVGKGGLKSQYKSMDCSIMEIADDIAYSIHDLEDAIAIGLLRPDHVFSALHAEFKTLSDYKTKGENLNYYKELIESEQLSDLKRAVTNIVKFFVDHTSIIELSIFENPVLDYQMTLSPEAEDILMAIKTYVFDNVINTASLKTIELKGQNIIGSLFLSLNTDAQYLLPKPYSLALDSWPQERVISDYLASMTDTEAGRLFERLYLPGNGSVFQPL